MKILKVYLERTYKTGEYENRKVGFDAEIMADEQPLNVLRDLEMLAHQHNENMLKVKTQAPPPQQPVKPAPQTTATNSNIHTQQPTQQQVSYNDCPRCGKPKKSQFPLCFVCNEEEKQRGGDQ